MNRTWAFIVFVFLLGYVSADQRRIGKRDDVNWTSHYQLGNNSGNYEVGEEYPDLSVVGAIISQNGALGTGTLIATNYVVTAAHVLKNDYYEIPDKSDWEFILSSDFGDANSSYKFQVDDIIIHPAWSARQTELNALGDGDELGVDLAILRLSRSITDVYPARLPSKNDDPLNERAVLAGFGTLVEGDSGNPDNSNVLRVGGENMIDRSVAQVFKSGVPENQLGGVLGIDFDSPEQNHNALESGKSVDLLGPGESGSTPLPLEASTAVGDSGGPAFCKTNGSWRIHGVVSYGTEDSTYGDVTIYTRLASHYDWLLSELPDWPSSKLLDDSGWVQNPWLGVLKPDSDGWCYHFHLGWIYFPSTKGNSIWGWSHLLNKWVWLSEKVFPFAYCIDQTSSFWMYFFFESENGLSFRAYDYSSNTWKNYP
jgi:secreted trypsin-like serine protease